ncbi:MAG TPA: hypothetical protein VMA73_16920 [Streptosporangiaceae bacterium]|nr:hypothetical protein [Streptosporangiaceae bacterium]
MGGRRAVRIAAALSALTLLTVQAQAVASVRSAAAGVHEAALEAVSCPRPKLCIAVGRRATPHGQAPFAERWTGSSWTIQAIPAPKASDAFLVSVSCPSASNCTAVGGEANSRLRFGLLAEQWNGHRWRVTQTGDPAGVTAGTLYSVSCARAGNCVAVGMWQGRTRNQTLSERWNGRSWKLMTAARIGRSAALTGVHCTASGFCMAVGEIASPGQSGEAAMAEELTKGAWHRVAVPVLPGSSLTVLNDTWCGSRFSCLAVGQSQGASNTAVAARWTGSSWTWQSMSGALNQILLGISCVSSAHCMAVGSGVTRPVSQQWTGATWTSVPTVHIAAGSVDGLYQVSCPTASRCIAVGARTNGGLGAIGSPLAEEWNGGSWSVLRTSSP